MISECYACGIHLQDTSDRLVSTCEWPLKGLGPLCNRACCQEHVRVKDVPGVPDIALCLEHAARLDRGELFDEVP